MFILVQESVNTQLAKAVVDGKPEQIRALVRKGADANFGLNGEPLIFQVIRNGPLENLRALVHCGARVGDQSPDGSTPIMACIEEGNREKLRLLLGAKSDPNQPGKSGFTALMLGSSLAKDELVRDLLRAGANANQSDSNGRSALLHSFLYLRRDWHDFETEQRHALVAQYLLKAGAKVNQRDAHGLTPLMVAASRQHHEGILVLLKGHANVNLTDDRGRSAITWCAEFGAQDLGVSAILAKKPRLGLMDLIMLGRRSAAIELIRKQGILKDVGPRLETPLMAAAALPDAEVVRELLRFKPNLEAKDVTGRTALTFALAGRPRDLINGTVAYPHAKPQESRIEVLKMLKDSGANIEKALVLARELNLVKLAAILEAPSLGPIETHLLPEPLHR